MKKVMSIVAALMIVATTNFASGHTTRKAAANKCCTKDSPCCVKGNACCAKSK